MEDPPQQPPSTWNPYGPQPPPYQPPPQPWIRPDINSALLRPRAGWYAASVIPLLFAAGLIALFVVLAIDAFPNRPKEFVAPGTLVVRADGAQDQTIYRHTAGAIGGSVPGRPDCTVRSADGGPPLTLDPAGNTTVSFGADEYFTAWHFDPPGTGFYRVSCQSSSPPVHQPLAVGERPRLAHFGVLVAAAIVSGFLGVLLAVGVAVIVAVMRSRHKRRLQDEAMAAAQAPGR
jgi:hypothetical protein